MEDINNVKRACGFYVSSMHLITMILPFIKNQISEGAKVETVLEYNLKENVSNILDNLIINEKEKEEISNINWSNNKIPKYSDFEGNMKNILEENNKIIILVNGNRKYIDEVNKLINKFIKKNINKISKKEITIINCYEVSEFDDNIREILDTHEFIVNTSGIHKIGDIFEDYRNKKVN